MANDQAHDTRGTSANRLAQAVSLIVAARAAPAVPDTPEGLLVSFDFAGGDTMAAPSVNTVGFSFGGSDRTIAPAPNGDLGARFRYFATAGNGQSWEEQRWSIETGLFENYELWSIWIPDNFEHRDIIKIPLVAGSDDISGWAMGDRIGPLDHVSAIFQDFDVDASGVTNIYLNFPQFPYYGTWDNATHTNFTQPSLPTVQGGVQDPGPENNKWTVQWAELSDRTYSHNAMGIEYICEPWDLVPEPSEFVSASTGVRESSNLSEIDGNSGRTGLRTSVFLQDSPSDIDPATDNGKLHEFVMRRRRSSTLEAKDGICQIWKNGVKVYERLDHPLFSVERNVFDKGYILGYANSGFFEQTDFYLTKFEIYGSTPPPGIIV